MLNFKVIHFAVLLTIKNLCHKFIGFLVQKEDTTPDVWIHGIMIQLIQIRLIIIRKKVLEHVIFNDQHKRLRQNAIVNNNIIIC